MYEIQFHPADIRKSVRYFFLSRTAVRWIIAGFFGAAVLLAAGLALAPLGIKSLLISSDLHILSHRKNVQLDVLEQRNALLEKLEKRLRTAQLQEQQIVLVFGVKQKETGMGGTGECAQLKTRLEITRKILERCSQLENESKALLVLLEDIMGFAGEHKDLVREVPAICPLPIGSFVLTSPFGSRTNPFTGGPEFHSGLDLAAHSGTEVYATGDARVVFAGRYPLRRNVRWWRYGNVVVLRHGEDYVTIYAHLERVDVRRGQRVKRGQTIGRVGSSGWSTSPHLHYEIRVFRNPGDEPVPVDPRIYILNYEWKGHEAALIRARHSTRPDFDPLPSRFLNSK